MKTIATRLQDGQDLMIEINKLAAEHDIKAGVILSAVGSLKPYDVRACNWHVRTHYVYP